MALDASVGTPTANSYVIVLDADTYFGDRSNSSKWVSTLNKEALLITASRLLDSQLKFDGFKVLQTQSMQFPRRDLTLSDGSLLPDNIIPIEIQFATYELAYLSIGSDRTADNALAGIEQVKAGPLFVKATPSGYGSTKADIIPLFIRNMLSDLLLPSGIGVVPLVRR